MEEWCDPSNERLKPDGGAIAPDHPAGCSGIRLLSTLEMARRSEVRFGLAIMCMIGVGQGIAVAVGAV